MGEKVAVISKHQFTDEFLNNDVCVCKMSKVEHTAVCLETDVDAIWQVLFCLTEYNAEED